MGLSAGHSWQWISELGLKPGLAIELTRRITTLNRVAFIAALLVVPFCLPAVNPTNDSFGWIEFFTFLGFGSVLFYNAIHQYQLAGIALVLAANFKIFFSASFRGGQAGEQLFFIPLIMGLLLLYDWDLRKKPEALPLWLLTLANFLVLHLTDFQLFGSSYALEAAVEGDIFLVNFLISLIISVAITFYFSRLAERQQTQIQAGGKQQELLNTKLEAHVRALSENNQQLLIQEKALIEARDAAQAADKAKSEFLGVMSHELRTPLHAVISLNQLLLETRLTPEQREYAETTLLSSENLFVIIDNLLNLSRFEGGNLKLDEVSFAVATTVQEVVNSYQKAAFAKQLRLSFFISPEVPPLLKGDVYRIQQILANLLSNGIKFTEKGSVKVVVKSRPLSQQQVAVCFQVMDTGIGIAPEAQGALFQPFFQIDGSSTRRQGGTGLGLAICQQLSQLMGGSLSLHSEAGKGSRFELEVPLQRQSPEAMAAPPPRPASFDIAPASFALLLVEDNLVNQKVALRMLSKLGYNATLALNGRQALETVQKRSVDLILMDLQMPEMNGIEATLAIRALDTLSPQPVIVAMTANVSDKDRAACRQAGMDDFLAKPVKKQQLERVLEKWMTRRTQD